MTSDISTLNGIIGACLTPFSNDGAVDYRALEAELEFLVRDVDAITIGAVEAAEYTLLSMPERKELMRSAVQIVAGRVPVIVGVSAPAVRDAVALARHAAECGAQAVQSLMPSRPWGGEPSTRELLSYFSMLADECELPMVAYHNPAAGADPPISAWIELADLPSVQVFKESSRDITKIMRLIEYIDRAGRARYFTTMQPLLPTLLLGGSGATMPPPATRIGACVVRAARAGDVATAVRWQRIFSMFPSAWSRYGLVPVMKAAMAEFGVDIGKPGAPYLPMSKEHHQELAEFLRLSGVLRGEIADDAALRQAATALTPAS